MGQNRRLAILPSSFCAAGFDFVFVFNACTSLGGFPCCKFWLSCLDRACYLDFRIFIWIHFWRTIKTLQIQIWKQRQADDIRALELVKTSQLFWRSNTVVGNLADGVWASLWIPNHDFTYWRDLFVNQGFRRRYARGLDEKQTWICRVRGKDIDFYSKATEVIWYFQQSTFK